MSASNRGVCRCVAGNACGSGMIVGHMNGGSLVLTNAHVVGTQIGRKVRVEIESLGMRRFTGEVIRAAYSNNVHADWAIVFIAGFQDIAPVYLSKSPPDAGEKLWTKGFPRCEPFNGQLVTQFKVLNNGVLLWLPNSIGGQSGSSVVDVDEQVVVCLLTWSMKEGSRWYGGGQMTSEIYKQNRAFVTTGALVGTPRMPGWEYEEQPCAVADEPFGDQPVIEPGVHSSPIETGIQDLPIWHEDQAPPPPPPGTGDGVEWRKRGVEYLRKRIEADTAELAAWEQAISKPIDPAVPGAIDSTFGL